MVSQTLHIIKLVFLAMIVACFIGMAYLLAGILVFVTLLLSGIAILISMIGNAFTSTSELRRKQRLHPTDQSRVRNLMKKKTEPS